MLDVKKQTSLINLVLLMTEKHAHELHSYRNFTLKMAAV